MKIYTSKVNVIMVVTNTNLYLLSILFYLLTHCTNMFFSAHVLDYAELNILHHQMIMTLKFQSDHSHTSATPAFLTNEITTRFDKCLKRKKKQISSSQKIYKDVKHIYFHIDRMSFRDRSLIYVPFRIIGRVVSRNISFWPLASFTFSIR